jgi:hypothetical protein
MRFRQTLHRLVLVTALCLPSAAAVSALATQPAEATTYVCGSSICSGSDGATGTNTQGHDPQIYIGEDGTWIVDVAGETGPCPSDDYEACFNTSGANGAISRLDAGTGLGVGYYYFLDGPASSWDTAPDAYCWGVWQAGQAVLHAQDAYNSYTTDDGGFTYIYADIEGGSGNGWGSSNYNNRQTFNGFYDYVDGNGSDDPSCPYDSGVSFQPGAYSSGPEPGSCGLSGNEWGTDMAGYTSISNTPIWTSEIDYSSTTQPSSFSCAAWFGSSSYNEVWQFHSGSTDYDIGIDPMYMPLYGWNFNS